MDNPHHLYLEYNRVVRRQERIYRNLVDRQNPLEHFSDVEIFTNFRFRRDTLLDIVNLLQPHLHRPNNRGQPLPPLFQLLLALKFLATNSFHLVTGQALGLSTKCTSWRAMRECQSIGPITYWARSIGPSQSVDWARPAGRLGPPPVV